MKKHLKSLFLLASSLFVISSCNSYQKPEVIEVSNRCIVRFLTNKEEEVTLTSGNEATSYSIIYETKEIVKGEKVSAPEVNPTKEGYVFNGWYTDKNASNLYDFNETIDSNLTLYAGWVRDSSSDNDNYEEVQLAFKEEVDSSISGLELNGVLNSKIQNNNVNLTTIGFRKLETYKQNIKELLNYKINPNTSIVSATYSDHKINISYKVVDVVHEIELSVTDITSQLAVSISGYETKAQNYEKNRDILPYNIVMGGSSSMENWSSSEDDMKPLTTTNVGIGGTTVEQWDECLFERLIAPFNPRSVVLYVGINNVINSKESTNIIGNRLISLFDHIHLTLPNTNIFYIYMNLIPGYMTYKNTILGANEIAFNYGANKDYMHYIDAGTCLLKENGEPNSSYFLTDGLHMSLFGYTLWGAKVKEAVMKEEKEIYKGEN